MKIILAILVSCLVSSSAFAEIEKFDLAAGDYLLVAKYQLADHEGVSERTDHVVMTYKAGGIYLVNVKNPKYPIVAQYADNRFYAHLDDAAGKVEFNGLLVSDGHVIGKIAGSSTKMGKLSGIFELKPDMGVNDEISR